MKSMPQIKPCFKLSFLTLLLTICCSQDLKCQTFYCSGKLYVLDSIWILSETDNDNQSFSATYKDSNASLLYLSCNESHEFEFNSRLPLDTIHYKSYDIIKGYLSNNDTGDVLYYFKKGDLLLIMIVKKHHLCLFYERQIFALLERSKI